MRIMISVRQILKRALSLTWHFKGMWLLGIFVTWLGTAGEVNVAWKSYNLLNFGFLGQIWQFFASVNLLSSNGFQNLLNLIKTQPISVFNGALVFLIIASVFFLALWLAIVSQTALIYSTAHAHTGKKFNFKSAWKFGMKKFWPMLALNLIAVAGSALLFYILKQAVSLPTPLFILFFDIMLLIILILYIIIKFSACSLVLQNLKFTESLKRGAMLFYKHWMDSIRLSAALFIVNIIYGLILAAAVLLILTPFLFIISITLTLQFVAAFWFNVYLAALLIFTVTIFTAAFVAAFYWSAWTLAFIQVVVGIDHRAQR